MKKFYVWQLVSFVGFVVVYLGTLFFGLAQLSALLFALVPAIAAAPSSRVSSALAHMAVTGGMFAVVIGGAFFLASLVSELSASILTGFASLIAFIIVTRTFADDLEFPRLPVMLSAFLYASATAAIALAGPHIVL